MTNTSHRLSLDAGPLGPVDLTLDECGQGRAFLLLHGGAGPASVAGFASLLGEHGRVLTPTHPGFGGTPRPEALGSIAGLAALYAGLLERLELREVTVVGNSIGGWIAAELALLAPSRLARLVLVDAVGIVVDGHPVADVFSLTPAELSRLSYHDPVRFGFDPSRFTDEQRAQMVGNRAALAVYGKSMGDPGLRERLAGVSVPTLVVWGEADRVVDADYGQAYAAAIPGAVFRLLAGTGHVPQIETPAALLEAVVGFGGG